MIYEDNNIARTNCFSKHLLGWELWVMACHHCFTSPEPKVGKGVTAVSTIHFHKKQSSVKTISVFAGKNDNIIKDRAILLNSKTKLNKSHYPNSNHIFLLKPSCKSCKFKKHCMQVYRMIFRNK